MAGPIVVASNTRHTLQSDGHGIDVVRSQRMVSVMEQGPMAKWRRVRTFIIAAVICLPATANAQKNIKVALALS